MNTEVIALIQLLRALTPELVGLVEDLGNLANGGEISTERLRELQQRGSAVSSSLADLIAKREAEEGS